MITNKINQENTETANISLQECVFKIKHLANNKNCFVDEIPEILQKDSNKFIVDNGSSILNGREITYNMKAYPDKIITKEGISYPIKWKF